jgi:hypothetical protein
VSKPKKNDHCSDWEMQAKQNLENHIHTSLFPNNKISTLRDLAMA